MGKITFRHTAIPTLFCFLLLMAAACGGSNAGGGQDPQQTSPVGAQSSQEADPRADWPSKLVLSFGPTEDQEDVSRRNEPLRKYLEDNLEVEVEYYFSTDYTARIEAMRTGHVDLGSMGPFAYVLAKERAGAEAFAVALATPEAEPFYSTLFITLNDSGIETLEDLKDRSIAWVDPASASGHLFPKAHLINELGLTDDTVDDYFSETTFAGTHDSAFLSVLYGDIDAAPNSSSGYDNRLETYKDHPDIDKMIVIEETTSIPRSPVTIRGDLPESLKEAIKELYLNAVNVPELQEYLEESRILGGYIPVDDSHYDVVRMTTTALGMDPEELMSQE